MLLTGLPGVTTLIGPPIASAGTMAVIWSVGSSTLPGRELHPLKSSVFHGALFANCDPSRGHDERHCPADDLRASLQHVRAIRKIHTQA